MPISIERPANFSPMSYEKMPDSTIKLPEYFKTSRFLEYDPLGKLTKAQSLLAAQRPRPISADLTVENVFLHSQFDEDIADEWRSTNEKGKMKEIGPVGDVGEKDPLPIEEASLPMELIE
jgi:hypothetical protein